MLLLNAMVLYEHKMMSRKKKVLKRENNNKTKNISQFTTQIDHYRQTWLVVTASWDILYLPHDQQSIDNLPKHNVFSIQEVTFGAGDKELATIRVRATVSH